MVITASELRQNVYRLLDQVLDTGEPIEIERGGRRLRIEPVSPLPKTDRLVPHPGTIDGDPADLVALDWSSEWRP